MVFKRRQPKTYYETVTESIYPRGGWRRAAQYIGHRLKRLPDPAHKISRGIAAGVFVCFTPFFGMHFAIAAALAWAMRGNVMAALLATFFGNPLTFPLIAAVSMEMGFFLTGQPTVPLPEVLSHFSQAALEVWRNLLAVFTPEPTRWSSLGDFWVSLFLPYLVGGIVPGIVTASAAYVLSSPVLAAYQKARVARMKRRFEKKREKIRSELLDTSGGADFAVRAKSRPAARSRPAAE